MNTSITFEHSLWLIIPCLIVAGLYAFVLYRNDFKQEDAPFFKYRKYLTALRFLTVLGILLLLLSPFIKSRNTESQKPIVAILVDKSESIRNGFKQKADTLTYFDKLNALRKKLEDKFEVVAFTIGDKTEALANKTLNAKATNISGAFEQINDQFYNQNIGAVVLASDGIFNQGINPVYATTNATYNIYTVAVGDTTIPKDLKIENVFYNKIAYLNDQFALKADVGATNLSGNTVTVSLSEVSEGKSRPLGSKSMLVNSNAFYNAADFIVPVTKTGIAHYVISVTSLNGEITYKNNTRDIFIEVLDGRQKILLLANSPHPDIAAIKTAVEANKNYSVDVQFIDDYTAKVAEYSLVILHQLPSNTNNAQRVIADINAAKKSTWFIVGTMSNLGELNKLQNTITISGNINKYNNVTPTINKDFTLFTLSENTQNAIVKFPPLSVFYGDYKSNPTAKTLFNQKINAVNTDYPLLCFGENGEQKNAILCGEGLWRWKLYNFMQNKNNEAFQEIINKTIQYLSVETDKRPFRVNAAKTIFADNEAIQFDAQLYNANFEMVNGTDVDMKIKDEAGKTYDFKFNKNDNYYTLNAGFLPSGSYKYSASTKLGANAYKVDGQFSVSSLQLEEINTVADFKLLNSLALAHNGKMVSLDETDKIAEELLAKKELKPILYDKFSTESAINLKWIFALLILLLSLEWFIRKWSGGY